MCSVLRVGRALRARSDGLQGRFRDSTLADRSETGDCAGLRGRRKRKEVFEEIKALAVDITQELDEHTNAAAETAFRCAAACTSEDHAARRGRKCGRFGCDR